MDIDKLQQLWQFVSKLHHGKTYGGKEHGQQVEYINHIGSVVFELMHVLKYAPELDPYLTISCALLHDTVEDTELSLQEILQNYGSEIKAGVAALTKDQVIEDPMMQMKDSILRIKQQPKEIWAVKMADRICNLFAPPFYWDNAKKLYYLNESKLIYCELKDGNTYLAQRLKNKIKDYELFLD